MRRDNKYSAFACALFVASVCAQPDIGHANELESGVATLFRLGEKNTPTQLKAAQAQYESLNRDFSNSAGLDYSYGLVLINQHQYSEAVPLIVRYLARYPNDTGALRAKIWAQLRDRQYLPALKETVRLSRHFAKGPRAKPAIDPIELAQQLGAIFGYLELARPDAVDDKVRQEAKRQVMSAVGETYLSAFDQGRQVVVDRLATLQDVQQQKQQRATDLFAHRQEELHQALEDSGQTIALAQENIQSGEEEIRDFQRKLKLIQHQLGSLANDRVKLTVQTIAVQAQLSKWLISESETIDLTQGSDRRDVTTSVTTSVITDRYPQIAALSATLTSLNKQAFRMDERIVALRSEANQLNAKGKQELQNVADHQAAAQQAQRRAKALESQVRRPKPEKPNRRGLTAEMKRLSTYLPFPFEEEKQRVLGWFAN